MQTIKSALSGVSAKASCHSYRLARCGRRWGWMFCRLVFIVGFSFVILYPIINMLTRALMLPRDLYDSAVLWVPKRITLANFKLAFRGLDYLSAFFNSLWSSCLATLLQLASCTFAGYAFARYNVPCRKLMFACVIITLVVPPQLTMVSSYIYFVDINIIDTQLPIILMSATGMGIRSGLFIYMFRQFFRSMPKETEEAAMVDGAGHFRIFFSVMLPGAMTVLVTVALFSFVWQWNDVFFTGLYSRPFQSLSNSVQTAAFGNLFPYYPEFKGFAAYDPIVSKNLSSTAVLLVVAPLVALFIFMQRFFVESVERSGVVG